MNAELDATVLCSKWHYFLLIPALSRLDIYLQDLSYVDDLLFSYRFNLIHLGLFWPP